MNADALQESLDRLDAALAVWGKRDDSKPQPDVRRAANLAVEAIDLLLGDLHAVRAQLVTEARESDEASALRADALLARRNAL